MPSPTEWDVDTHFVILNIPIMLQPFQCLLYCSRSASQSDVLLAASGHLIFSFKVQDGSLLSTWPSPPKHSLGESASFGDAGDLDYERRAKRQRVTLSRDASGSDSVDIVVESRIDIDSAANKNEGSTSNVAKLVCTSDSKYVIAVTAEDKSIRVFELLDGGDLAQISKRYYFLFSALCGALTETQSRPMPKRPCTIALTPDGSTILCGDKFGDVYSLPLLGTLYESGKQETVGSANGNTIEPPRERFVPTANSRTVHTKKNQEALRNQQKQVEHKPEKQVLQFEHQLLLGHVSLLTDLAYVRLNEDDSPSGKRRDYILTSDRDEHIRVSRGIPQAHIIEGYCLGHTEFISKLCVPQQLRQLLLSGGGDGYLWVWDWMSGTLRQKLDLRKHLAGMRDLKGTKEVSELNIAVSGIWDTSNKKPQAHQVDVIVTCEGYVPSFPVKCNLLTRSVSAYRAYFCFLSMLVRN